MNLFISVVVIGNQVCVVYEGLGWCSWVICGCEGGMKSSQSISLPLISVLIPLRNAYHLVGNNDNLSLLL